MPPDKAAIIAVIIAALRELRPDLPLPAAQLEAETIVARLHEAGALAAPLRPKPDGAAAAEDRIVLLPDGDLECMACENRTALTDAVPAQYLSEEAKRDLG